MEPLPGPFLFPEAAIRLVCAKNRDLWPPPTPKSAIHGLIVKSDWLKITEQVLCTCSEIGSAQRSRSPAQTRRIVGTGDENVPRHDVKTRELFLKSIKNASHLFLRLFLSFSFDREDILNTRDSVSSHFQIPPSSKNVARLIH